MQAQRDSLSSCHYDWHKVYPRHKVSCYRMHSGEFSVLGESLMEQCCVEAVTQWIKVTLLLHFVFSNLCQQAFATAGAGAQLISKLVRATMIVRGGKLLSSLEEMVFVLMGILGEWC